jgi:hypothetical protein
MPSVEATLKRFPPRKDSPPPISNPRPHSEPTTALELELVRVRTELADQREALKKAQAAAVTYPEAPWWRTTDGMVKVIGAFFAGLALIGAGGWFVSRQEAPQAPAAPTPTADVTCPVFADQNAPRSSLCMRINQIESAIGALQSQRAARVERESREKVMLGERPDVKPGNQPNH